MESGSKAAPNFYTGDPLVIGLQARYWERRLHGDSIWLVEFYAPWCSHCQRFAKDWKQVTTCRSAAVLSGSLFSLSLSLWLSLSSLSLCVCFQPFPGYLPCGAYARARAHVTCDRRLGRNDFGTSSCGRCHHPGGPDLGVGRCGGWGGQLPDGGGPLCRALQPAQLPHHPHAQPGARHAAGVPQLPELERRLDRQLVRAARPLQSKARTRLFPSFFGGGGGGGGCCGTRRRRLMLVACVPRWAGRARWRWSGAGCSPTVPLMMRRARHLPATAPQ
jgi:hypothetical protein